MIISENLFIMVKTRAQTLRFLGNPLSFVDKINNVILKLCLELIERLPYNFTPLQKIEILNYLSIHFTWTNNVKFQLCIRRQEIRSQNRNIPKKSY